MGEEIKSAMEIAMEKIEKLGSATEEERLKWKYVPEGEKLAARYMKQELNLVTELGKCEEKAKKHVAEGAADIFVRHIILGEMFPLYGTHPSTPSLIVLDG